MSLETHCFRVGGDHNLYPRFASNQNLSKTPHTLPSLVRNPLTLRASEQNVSILCLHHSAGVALLELITIPASVPFLGAVASPRELLERIDDPEFVEGEMPRDASIATDNIRRIIRRCCAPSPQRRPSHSDIEVALREVRGNVDIWLTSVLNMGIGFRIKRLT